MTVGRISALCSTGDATTHAHTIDYHIDMVYMYMHAYIYIHVHVHTNTFIHATIYIPPPYIV